MMSDSQLLRAYVEDRSEASFADLVLRHIDWVHSAAVRMVGDQHLAEDVTQTVFITLSCSAHRLLRRERIAPWLFEVLRRTAANAKRARYRRRLYEQLAATMKPETIITAPGQSDWQSILDELVARLRKKDRELVLMRFYEQKSLADVGRATGVSEDAARKRVERAVDRLRKMLAARGIASLSSAGLMTVLAGIVKPVDGAVATQAINNVLACKQGLAIAWFSLASWSYAKAVAVVIAAFIASFTSSILLQPAASTSMAQAAVTPSRELFNRYLASTDWKKSVGMRYDIETEQRGETPGKRRIQFVYYRDGQREHASGFDVLSNDNNNAFRTDVFQQVLGERFAFRMSGMQTETENSYLSSFGLRANAQNRHLERNGGSIDADYDGTLAAALFREAADQLCIRETDELIDGIACKVLEGQLRGIDLKLWIAPSRGYNALKQVVEWDGPDLLRDQTLESMGISRILHIVDQIKIEQIGDVFVPISGQSVGTTYFKDGRQLFTRISPRRSDIRLKPDFAALDAFTITLPVGTRIRQEEDRDGSYYQWRKESPVPVDQILEQLGRKFAGNEPPKLPVPAGSMR